MEKVTDAKEQLMQAIRGLKFRAADESVFHHFDFDLEALVKRVNSDAESMWFESALTNFQDRLEEYVKKVDLERNSAYAQFELIVKKVKVFYSALDEKVKEKTPTASGSSLKILATQIRRDEKVKALSKGKDTINAMMNQITEMHNALVINEDNESSLAFSAEMKVQELTGFDVAKEFVTSSAKAIYGNQGARTEADVLLSKFLDAYANKLKNDFKSLGGQYRKSNLSLPSERKLSSDHLIAAIHHAAFNGGKRTESALRKAGVLAKDGWKPNPNLPADQQEAVSEAINRARQRVSEEQLKGGDKKEDRVLQKRIAKFDKSIGKEKARPAAFEKAKQRARSDAAHSKTPPQESPKHSSEHSAGPSL